METSRPGTRPGVVAALLAAGALATTVLGFVIGADWLFPFLGAAVPIPLFLDRVRRGRPGRAAAWVLLWALFQSLAVGIATWLFPERAAEVVHRGVPYTAEMLHWVRTGEGPEGSPALYLPVHARHYAGFCVLSLVSVGTAGLVLGTWLLNYMNFYVAELVRVSADPATATLLGWPVWAAIRVVGYVVTGSALASLSLHFWRRTKGRETSARFPARLFLLGFGLVVADAVLKWLLAPAWQGILFRALGADG